MTKVNVTEKGIYDADDGNYCSSLAVAGKNKDDKDSDIEEVDDYCESV